MNRLPQGKRGAAACGQKKGKKKPSSEGPFSRESQAARLDSFSPACSSLASVDGVERVVADLANDAAGGPARCDRNGREMICLRNIDQAFALGQAPVVEGVAGDFPRLGPRNEVGNLEILRCGGNGELAWSRDDCTHLVAAHAAIAAP